MQKKETAKRVLLFLLAAAILLFAAVAWFTESKVADMQPIRIYSADSSKITAELFHKTGMEGEKELYTKVSRLECSNFLPGQTEKYKLVLTNADTLDYDVRVDFLEFSAEDERNLALCKALRLEHLQADPAAQEGEQLSRDGTFAELYTLPTEPENTSFLFANGISVRAMQGDQPGVRTLFFEITLPGGSSNEYQNLRVKLSSIAVQTTLSQNG